MRSWQIRAAARLKCALLAAMLCAPMMPHARAQAVSPSASAAQSSASLEPYKAHLQNLQIVVTACRKQRNRDACNPAQVGSDDQVQWSAGSAVAERPVRYDWLRELMDRAGKEGAGKKEEPQKETQKESAVPMMGEIVAKPVSVDAQLAEAQQRLNDDLKQAGGSAAQAQANHAAERNSITTILAGREYQGVSQSSARERFLEWLENWLAQIFGHLAKFGARSPWLVVALRALLLGVLCVGLVWALVRIERRSRLRLVPDMPPAANAPSAREWQLWFQDAQRMAAQGQWRDAIHFLYWASISRLESKRMWPADRARTPREYLRLFPAADARKDSLTALTRSFERTWYGGREADATEFDAALNMAAGLGVE